MLVLGRLVALTIAYGRRRRVRNRVDPRREARETWPESLKEVTCEMKGLHPPHVGAALYTRGDIGFRGLGREY